MRPKSAPALLTSQMPPQRVYLQVDRPAWIQCPWCDKWYSLKRKMLPAHNDFAKFDENTDRCPGSAQLIELEPIGKWIHRYRLGVAEVAPRRAGAYGPNGRRQGRVMLKPAPPVPTPLHRMAAAR